MSLSTGAIKVLYNDEKSNPLHTNLTLQIISIEAVTVQGSIQYMVIISDGVNYMQAMLARQLSALVDSKEVKRNIIISLKKFVCHPLLLLDFDVVQVDVESKIGAPTSCENACAPAA